MKIKKQYRWLWWRTNSLFRGLSTSTKIYTPTDSIPYDGPITHREMVNEVDKQMSKTYVTRDAIVKLIANVWSRRYQGLATHMFRRKETGIYEIFSFRPYDVKRKKVKQKRKPRYKKVLPYRKYRLFTFMKK